MFYYVDEAGSYYESDSPLSMTPVAQRPTPAEEYKLESLDVQNEDGTFGTWVHDADLPKRTLGKVPTEVFINTVFAPPTGMENPPADYIWNRENIVRMVSPATGIRMPKYGYLSGTKAEITLIAQWMLTNTWTPNTFPPVFTPVVPDAEGHYVGGIISEEEYGRAITLLDLYGVQ